MGYVKYHYNQTMTESMLNQFEKDPEYTVTSGTTHYHYQTPYYAGEWLVWHIPTYYQDGYYTYATTSHSKSNDDPEDSSYEDGDKYDYYYNFNAITGINFLNHSGYNSVGLYVGDMTTANNLTFGRGDVSAGESATLSNLTFTSGGTVVLGDTFSDGEGDNTVWYATTDARLTTMKAKQDFDYVVALNGASSYIKDVEVGRNMRDLVLAAPGGSYGFSASNIDGNGTVVSQVKVGGRLSSVYVGKGAVLDTLNVGSQRSWGAGDVSAFGYFSSSYAGSGGRWVLSSATYMTVGSGGTATNIHLENGGQVTVMGPSTLVTSTYNSATSQWVVTSSEGSGAGGTLSHLFMATSGGLKFDGLADHETWNYPTNGYSNSSSYMSGFLATAPQSAYVQFESNTVGSNINIGNGGSMRINSGASVNTISMGALTTSTYYTNSSGTTDMWIGDRGAKLTMNGGFASNVIVEAAPMRFEYYSAAHNHFTTLSSSIGESMQNAYYSAHGEYPTWNDAWRQQIYDSASAGYRAYVSSLYQSAYQSNYDCYIGGEVNVHNAAIVKLSGFGTLTAVHYGSSGLSNGEYYYSAFAMDNVTSATGALSATVNVGGGAHLSSVTVMGGCVVMGYNSGGITRMTGMENPQSNFAWVENLNLRTSGLVGDNNSAVIFFSGYNYSNTVSIPVTSNGKQVYTSDGYASHAYFSYDCIDPGEIQYASGDSGLTVQGTYGRFTYTGSGAVVIGGLGTVWEDEAGSRCYYSSGYYSSSADGTSKYVSSISRWLTPSSRRYEFGVVKGVIDESSGKLLKYFDMIGENGFDWTGTLAIGSGAVVKDVGSKNGLKTANTLTSDSWNPVIEEDVSKKLVVLAGGSADNVAVTGKVTNYERTSQYLYQSNAALVVSSGGTATNVSVLGNGIAMAIGGTIDGAFVGSGGILYLSGWGGALQVSSDGGKTIAGAQYLDEGVLNNVHLDKGGQLGAVYDTYFGGKAPSIIANTGGGVLNGVTANGVAYMSGVDFAGGVNLGAGQQAVDVTVRGFTTVTSRDAEGNPTAWTTTIAYMNVSSGGIVNGATVGEDGGIYVSDGANVKNLVASGGRLIFGNSSGWSDYFPGSAAVAGITVMDGGILEVNSKFALKATDMQVKESAGLELAIVKDADENYAKTELNGTWTAGWGSGTFTTTDGVLSGFGGQFGFEYTDPIYGSKYTSARLSMTFLNSATLLDADMRGFGYFTVRDGAKVLNTKIKGITANIGGGGYASGLYAMTDPTNSAYQTNIYVYGNSQKGTSGFAEQTVMSGGYMMVEDGGFANGVTMLAPEGYEGPAGDSKKVGPAELEIVAGGTVSNVFASAGVVTIAEGSKEPGTGPSTLSNAEIHSSAMLLVNADGVVLDGALKLAGTVVTTAERYKYVEVQVTDPDTGDTYTDWQRVTLNNAVADAKTLTVNFDLTEHSEGFETALIDNLANLEGVKLEFITVNENQAAGSYVLAGGAQDYKTGTLKVVRGGKSAGTITVDGYLQVEDDLTYSLLHNDNNELVFSVTSTDAAITNIVATSDGKELLKGKWSKYSVNIKTEVNKYTTSIWYRIKQAVKPTTRGLRSVVQVEPEDDWIELDNDKGIDITEYCTVELKAKNENGKDSEIVTYTVNYDATAPEFSDLHLVSGDAFLTPGEVSQVSVLVWDELDLTPKVEFSLDGEQWTELELDETSHAKFSVTGGVESFTLRTTDHADNVNTLVVSTPAAPTVSADILTVTNQDVTVTAAFSADSTLKQYSLDGGETWLAYGESVVLKDNATVSFRAGNILGYSEAATLTVDYIDKEPPAAPTAAADITEITNGNVTVTPEFSADSVKKEYTLDGGETWADYNDGGVIIIINGTVGFRGVDAAGNFSEVTNVVINNIDKEPPMAPTAVADITALTNKDVTVTADFSEDSVKKEYTLDGGETWADYNEGGVIIIINGTVGFRGADAAGNFSEVATYEVSNIDKEAPTISNIAPSTTEPAKSVLVTATFADNVAVAASFFKLGDGEWTVYPDGGVLVSENTTVYFKAVDAAGNEATESYEVTNIDKVAPTITGITPSTIEPTNQDVIVTAFFEDDVAVAASFYKLGDSEWTVYPEGGVLVSENTTVYFKAVDAAGNEATESYEVTNIDKVAPTITGITPSTTEPTNQSVTVTAVFSDDVAVAASFFKLGDDEWTVYPEGGVTVTENATVYFKAVDTSGNESEVASYEVANIQAPDPDNTPDNGWNDYVYDKKKGWNTVENIDRFASNVITGNGEICLDVVGTIDFEGMHNMFGNDGTNLDTGDVGKMSVPISAKVSFSVKSSADGTFYIYEDGFDKKGNRKLLEVGKVTVKNGKVAALSNICLAAGGIYYAQMSAKNVRKAGTQGVYNVTVVDSTIFRDADDGWNNEATNKAVVENPFYLERGVKTIKLDNTDMIDGGDYNNFVGFSDSVDYAKLELASTAYLSFDLSANGNAKFTLWKRDTGTGKFAKVGGVTTLKTKNGAQVTKSTKAQLLQVSDKYEYFVSMEGTDAAKGASAYYNVNVNTVATRFFDSADGGENNWLFDKKKKTYNDDANLRSNTISASGDNAIILDNNPIGDNAFRNFVGYQDSVDYAKIVLTQSGSLTFKITALADVTFEIWQKGTDKKGKNVLNSLQKKTSLKVKDYAVGASTTTEVLTLGAGEYYVSVTAKNTKANEKGSAYYNVTAMFSPSEVVTDALAMPELSDSLAMTDTLSFGQYDADALAGASAAFLAKLDDKSAWQNLALA